MKKNFTLGNIKEIRAKMEFYCAYQERCYKEIEHKLFEFQMSSTEREETIMYLIENNFVNEERFAKSFVRGKHNYKFWGKNRIINELKFRNISSRNIQIALQEIPETTYLQNFHIIAEKNWETIKDPKGPKKNKKFVDFLLRKGYETNLIYEKLNELEAGS